MKQYIGIVRDHSGSMYMLKSAAITDYNNTIKAIKNAAQGNDVPTVVSVVEIGGGGVQQVVQNSNINAVGEIATYYTDGGTPLFDGVAALVKNFESIGKEAGSTFLIMAITDGEENQSRSDWAKDIKENLKKLQLTDRWTFVFRVPRGYAKHLTRLGIPSGNIQEWETSERGLQESSAITAASVSSYYGGVSRGVTSTQKFFVNMDKIKPNQVNAAMKNISDEVAIFPVAKKSDISSFVTLKTKQQYVKGTGFYQLSKPEKIVQDYKLIVVRNQKTGAVYAGGDARSLLGLPDTGNISLRPGNHGDWDVFIQSTSSNRILFPGTSALIWQKIS